MTDFRLLPAHLVADAAVALDYQLKCVPSNAIGDITQLAANRHASAAVEALGAASEDQIRLVGYESMTTDETLMGAVVEAYAVGKRRVVIGDVTWGEVHTSLRPATFVRLAKEILDESEWEAALGRLHDTTQERFAAVFKRLGRGSMAEAARRGGFSARSIEMKVKGTTPVRQADVWWAERFEQIRRSEGNE